MNSPDGIAGLLDEPRALVLAWAESGGFAATHGAGASPEAIVDDLLAFLARKGYAIVRGRNAEELGGEAPPRP